MIPLFSLFLSLSGCVADVGEGKVAAEVADAPAAEKAEPAAGGKVLKIDTASSRIHALGAKITATHPIDFKTWEGTITVDGDKVVDLDFSVDVASLESDHPKLTSHLKEEDFLFVEKHPKATFDATSITEGATAEGASHTVVGNLEIRGVAKQVTFPATLEAKDGVVNGKAEFTINRQDFGVTYKGRADDLVQDNVVLTIEVHAAM